MLLLILGADWRTYQEVLEEIASSAIRTQALFEDTSSLARRIAEV